MSLQHKTAELCNITNCIICAISISKMAVFKRSVGVVAIFLLIYIEWNVPVPVVSVIPTLSNLKLDSNFLLFVTEHVQLFLSILNCFRLNARRIIASALAISFNIRLRSRNLSSLEISFADRFFVNYNGNICFFFLDLYSILVAKISVFHGR